MKSKSTTKKRISVFYFLIILIITSVILVIYINNIVYVNQLSVSNNNLKEDINKHIQSNDILRTEAEKLSSFERIKVIAGEKFNLSYKENSIEEKNNITVRKSQLK